MDLNSDKDISVYMYLRGLILSNCNLYFEAINEFDNVIYTNPAFLSAYLNLSKCLALVEDY